MIGNKSPNEMRKIIREKLGMTDAELLESFNKSILEAQAKAPELPDAGETLKLMRDALLRETKRKPPAKPKQRKAAAKK